MKLCNDNYHNFYSSPYIMITKNKLSISRKNNYGVKNWNLQGIKQLNTITSM
jgi:hypothetical protein